MSQFEGRRLSVVRLGVLVAVIAALVLVSMRTVSRFELSRDVKKANDGWFAGYVDVTATPSYAFENPATDAGRSAVLSFIVADHADPCRPSWGGFYTLDQAASDLDLDRRIARLRAYGGTVTVSFGGLENTELAVGCTNVTALYQAYRSVVDRYALTTVDLDVEGAALTDTAANIRRARALSRLQAAKGSSVWLTLPVSPQGLTDAGRATIATTLAGGVRLAGVNLMTMDYGGSRPASQSMGAASISALAAAHGQIGALYRAAGTKLNSTQVWQRMGATPMAGQNDVAGEVFGLEDASTLAAFAHAQRLGRMSLWSMNRDQRCGPNWADVSIVSDACSGVAQDDDQFADILAAGGGAGGSVTAPPTATPSVADPTVVPSDDPATSPYPVWRADGVYLTDDHVVWHQNVYLAKWWTSGDMPDDPTVSADASPWQLIGPVLPGEKPTPTPTLPAGSYPRWDSTSVYVKGDRVLLGGVPYVALWWNQNQSPLAPSTREQQSPWRHLTAEEYARATSTPAAKATVGSPAPGGDRRHPSSHRSQAAPQHPRDSDSR